MSRRTKQDSVKPTIYESPLDSQWSPTDLPRRPPVLTKKNFVQRYKKGEFGNAAPTWDTVEEFGDCAYQDAVHLRSRKAGGKTYYNLFPWHAYSLWLDMPGRDYYCSAMAPHHRGTIQGEVQETDTGLALLWTRALLPMREALAQFQRQAFRVEAVTLLRTCMNPKSYRWLRYLLEEYPSHVIEFTCFDCCWGTVPGHNTVFWEIRKY